MNRCLVSAAVCLAAGLSAWADGASPELYRDAARAAKEKGAKAYVMDGLVAQWDGIENAGYGLPHVSTAKAPWKELTGHRADIDTSKCKWNNGDNAEALYVNGYWNSAKMATMEGTLPSAHTIEVCLRATASAGTGYILNGMPFFIISHNPGSGNPGLLYSKPCFGGYGLNNSTSYGGNYHFSPLRGATYSVSHNGVVEANSVRCYISGGLTKKNTPTALSTGREEVYLASSGSNNSGGINAYYYSIRIYDRVLSDDEIYWNSVVDNHRFTTLDVGCITADNSVNPNSVAYSVETLEVQPNTFDWMATEGIDFSSMPTGGIIVVR